LKVVEETIGKTLKDTDIDNTFVNMNPIAPKRRARTN
jgi:hypothetical protein